MTIDEVYGLEYAVSAIMRVGLNIVGRRKKESHARSVSFR